MHSSIFKQSRATDAGFPCMELLNMKQYGSSDGSTLATPSWEDRAALGHWPGGKPRGEAAIGIDVRPGRKLQKR